MLSFLGIALKYHVSFLSSGGQRLFLCSANIPFLKRKEFQTTEKRLAFIHKAYVPINDLINQGSILYYFCYCYMQGHSFPVCANFSHAEPPEILEGDQLSLDSNTTKSNQSVIK